MKTKHKLIQDFQFLSSDNKIFILKAGTIIEEYIFKIKGEEIPISSDVVSANPQYFQLIDWQTELHLFLRASKLPQPAQLLKKLVPFIEEMILSSIQVSEDSSDSSDYKARMKELNDKEVNLEREYRSKMRQISEKEFEYESKIQKMERREKDHDVEYNRLIEKEADIRKKLIEVQEKEDTIRNLEIDLNKRERGIDRIALESEKTIDDRQKAVNERLEKKLKDIDDRESRYNSDMKKLLLKESEIVDREEKVSKEEKIPITKLIKVEEMLTNYHSSVHWGIGACPIQHCNLNFLSNKEEGLKKDLEEALEEIRSLIS